MAAVVHEARTGFGTEIGPAQVSDGVLGTGIVNFHYQHVLA